MSTYVISDIHGRKERFYKMIETLNFKDTDTIYVLGDVIDRGIDGIEILQYIKNHEQFKLLMGNHEYMMLQYYDEIKKENINPIYEERWFRNGATPTYLSFEALDTNEKEEILEYIRLLPLAICDLKVNDRLFYLVHGAPVNTIREGTIYLHTILPPSINAYDFIWERINVNTEYLKDRCAIIGHTMTCYYQDTQPYRIYSDHEDLNKATLIDIDCGCAANNMYASLAVLRLDDMEVFYI